MVLSLKGDKERSKSPSNPIVDGKWPNNVKDYENLNGNNDHQTFVIKVTYIHDITKAIVTIMISHIEEWNDKVWNVTYKLHIYFRPLITQ